MARPQKCRMICSNPQFVSFLPEGGKDGEVVTMGYDEYEVIRLLDYEKYTQQECADRMEVARTTITRMYEAARGKVADVLVNGKRLQISGGDVHVCTAIKPECAGRENCCHLEKKRVVRDRMEKL